MAKFQEEKRAAESETEDRAQFSEAPDVQEIAERLIPQWHDHLRNARIKYLFNSKTMSSKGQTVLGKAQKAAALVKFFGDCDFVVIMNLTEWMLLDAKQRTALVDHELCHCSFKVSDTGLKTWALRGHDVEEFREIISRHGLWSNSVSRFAEEVQQLDLFNTAGTKRGRKKAKR